MKKLTPEEQAAFAQVSRLTVQHLETTGCRGLEIGQGYLAEDYADFLHLAESGGAKMAATVVPVVRAMAR